MSFAPLLRKDSLVDRSGLYEAVWFAFVVSAVVFVFLSAQPLLQPLIQAAVDDIAARWDAELDRLAQAHFAVRTTAFTDRA